MKSKKALIFWICYYAMWIIGNVVAAILLPNRLNFNGWSAFPIAYMVMLPLWYWYEQTDFAKERWEEYVFFRRKHNDIDRTTFFEMREKKRNRNRAHNEVHHRVVTCITFLCVPILFPFVLFFSYTAKIISGAITMAICVCAITVWNSFCDPYRKELKKRKEKELKEQQQREELGRWK